MPPRLVLFDFDGTLADSFPFFAANMGVLADRHGFLRLPEHELDELRTLGAREILARARVPLWKLPVIAADFRRMMAERIDDIRLFPGTGEMLAALKAGGVRIGVVTSNSEANVRRALGRDLSALIDHYGCGLALFGKTRKLRQMLAAARIQPSGAVLVGDELRDLEAARQAGILFAAVTWGYTLGPALAAARPDLIVESMDALAASLLDGACI
ncbi:HAD hydrolase-like protein [Chthonobacter rhizosphaerae]|uniref:HAD hydrolase-like protein n=1 Tax=Chthonobacter rhizosphaerae TaxID=2735553 RepID=UPI0015EE9AD7|nr:HAD hydrolase-like protein [Chthonobacter rhizosphaerae]